MAIQFRHQRGQTASVIDVGVMGDVGFVSQIFQIQDRIEKTGMRILREHHLLDALALAWDRSKPLPTRPLSNNGAYEFSSQLLIGLMTSMPISSPFNRVAWKRDLRMDDYIPQPGQVSWCVYDQVAKKGKLEGASRIECFGGRQKHDYC
ncbi:hypothetical protein F4824DRAFT_500616 [Ustulina deusta]|nr:hypothetical protein F4824DRAFT_500616 [Ustulina deusta]